MATPTALSMAVETPPPRLMFATAGPLTVEETQSMPATMPAVEPMPSQPSTRTGMMFVDLATP